MAEVPFDRDAERMVVGAMLTPLDYNDFLRILREIADTGLVAGDFWDPKCRYTFAGINWLLEKGGKTAVDEKQVYDLLRRSANPEVRQVSFSWLYGLAENLFTTVWISWYAQRVVDLAKQRRLQAAGHVIATSDEGLNKAVALIENSGKRKPRFRGSLGSA
jgi:replicative DNA helicase